MAPTKNGSMIHGIILATAFQITTATEYSAIECDQHGTRATLLKDSFGLITKTSLKCLSSSPNVMRKPLLLGRAPAMDTRKAGAKYRSVGHGNLRTYLLPQYMRCLILTGTRIVPLLKSMHLYLLYTCISIGLPNMLGRSQRVRDQCSHINLVNEGVRG